MMSRIVESIGLSISRVASVAFVACLYAPAVSTAVEPSTGALFIQVKTARLRIEPKHWSPSGAALQFGSSVEELSREGDWLKVKGAGEEVGFLHASAVTSRSVVFKGKVSETDVRTEPTDVVLAGKGFANQLESVFRSGEPGLDYATVDKLEQRVMDGEALAKFLRDGKLRVGVIERGTRG